MKQYIEFQLNDSSTILVEVDEPEEIGAVAASRGDEISSKARDTFDAAIGKIKPVANTIINNIRDISDPPDEIEVLFGLKMHAEAGAIIAATGIEANYSITLKWKKEDKKG